jgi:RHS repeat-associated protein
VNHITYDAFGNITSETAPSTFHIYAYTGRERDHESDLQYNWHRYYDASIGQWISEDTIGFSGSDGNLRRYVANIPTSFTDPTGTTIEGPYSASDGRMYFNIYSSRATGEGILGTIQLYIPLPGGAQTELLGRLYYNPTTVSAEHAYAHAVQLHFADRVFGVRNLAREQSIWVPSGVTFHTGYAKSGFFSVHPIHGFLSFGGTGYGALESQSNVCGTMVIRNNEFHVYPPEEVAMVDPQIEFYSKEMYSFDINIYEHDVSRFRSELRRLIASAEATSGTRTYIAGVNDCYTWRKEIVLQALRNSRTAAYRDSALTITESRASFAADDQETDEEPTVDWYLEHLRP